MELPLQIGAQYLEIRTGLIMEIEEADIRKNYIRVSVSSPTWEGTIDEFNEKFILHSTWEYRKDKN
jgi:hypothetical protein